MANAVGETVHRFVAPDGLMRYSVRRRPNGAFQVVHDGAVLEDGTQPYWMEDCVLSGLYATAEEAEAELGRLTGGHWTREY